ncbi:MAG TPA: phosphotransferase [Chloroflexia bacterium]|nr:phosphotransferase [Chloroflexia bacterium]
MNDKRLDRYRAAIQEKFPALAITSLAYLSEGWDSVACLVNEEMVFRFPKRKVVESVLKVEIALLPELAPTLPLPVPHFDFVSKARGKNFPYAFVGYPILPGEPLDEWPEENWWQPQLGPFLSALHAFPVSRARQLGVKEQVLYPLENKGQGWKAYLADFYALCRERINPLLSQEQQTGLQNYFVSYLNQPAFFEFEPKLIHADLGPEHVLADFKRLRLTGIIDFGDVSLGDPAFDVPESVRPFYQGEPDPTYPERRRFYSKLGPLVTILFGLDHQDALLVEYGLNTIEF